MYNNQQQPPSYGQSSPNTYPQPVYYNQYNDNTYANQSSQPTYQTDYNQPPPYSAYGGQQQSYSSQPMHSSAPQQPASHGMTSQSPQYSAPVQQQQPFGYDQNSSSNSSPPSGTPFSPGYKWPRKSISITCPACGASVTTRLEKSITPITIIGVILLFLFTCILACLPFCISSCKKTTHYCPNCNGVLGVRKELR